MDWLISRNCRLPFLTFDEMKRTMLLKIEAENVDPTLVATALESAGRVEAISPNPAQEVEKVQHQVEKITAIIISDSFYFSVP